MAIFRMLVFLLLLLATSFCQEDRLLVAYPVASRQMQFLMRNLAVILADDGYHVTVLSTDESKFLSHPNISSHILEMNSTYTTPECSVQSEEIDGCKQENTTRNSALNFWENEIVNEMYQKKDTFAALIAPSVGNEFCFSFIKDSHRDLILLTSSIGGPIYNSSYRQRLIKEYQNHHYEENLIKSNKDKKLSVMDVSK